jgi:hypothetical protein
MKVSFDKSSHKRLVKIKDKTILDKVRQTILLIENIEQISQIPAVKKWRALKLFTGYA